MPQISSMATGGATITASALAPLMAWAFTGFHLPLPPSLPLIAASVLLTGAHALYNLAQNRKLIPPKPLEPVVPTPLSGN